jgi:hypothetical protein
MSDSPQESQKRHLSKIRPHGLVTASCFTNVYARLLAFTAMASAGGKQLAMTWRNGWRIARASAAATAGGWLGPRPASCARQHAIVQCNRNCYEPRPWSGEDALDGYGYGDTDAAFPCGKPPSDQRRAAEHLGDCALPRCRNHERTGAPRISSGRYERRGLDDASRGLGGRSSLRLVQVDRDSEMAPQAIGIARNGIGNGSAGSCFLREAKRPLILPKILERPSVDAIADQDLPFP